MREARLAVDVVRVSGRGGDAGVDRLAALADQNEIVDHAFAQRPENVLPGLRQGTIAAAKRFRYRRPGQSGGGAVFTAVGLIAIRPGTAALRHGRIPAFRSLLPRAMIFRWNVGANAQRKRRYQRNKIR